MERRTTIFVFFYMWLVLCAGEADLDNQQKLLMRRIAKGKGAINSGAGKSGGGVINSEAELQNTKVNELSEFDNEDGGARRRRNRRRDFPSGMVPWKGSPLPQDYWLDDGCEIEGDPTDGCGNGGTGMSQFDGGFTSISEEKYVRCCAVTGSTCISPDTVTTSPGDGTCSPGEDKKWLEARNFCLGVTHENKNWRLCSKEELKDDRCCCTGCNFDSKQVWTATFHDSTTACEWSLHEGYFAGGKSHNQVRDSTWYTAAAARTACLSDSNCEAVTCAPPCSVYEGACSQGTDCGKICCDDSNAAQTPPKCCTLRPQTTLWASFPNQQNIHHREATFLPSADCSSR